MQSLVYHVKSTGELTQTCTGADGPVDFDLLSAFVRKEKYHFRMKGFTFICFSLWTSKCGCTLLRAELKSTNSTHA